MRIATLALTAVLAGGALGLPAVAQAAGGGGIEARHWSFQGVFGTFDRAAAQRGFQVFNEVCAACHSLKLVAYRDLAAIGFSEDQIKEVAAAKQVVDGPNKEGDMFERPGRPSDRFVSPFANDNAARTANNGAMPPDLSLMVKARVGGPDYLYGLLTGYGEAPADMQMMEGMNYNKAFPGHQIAMAPPIAAGQVTYADGTEATLERMAQDIVTFLAWTAEPELEERKRVGLKVILFLIVLTALLYATKRKIWKNIH
jgi:ubiquinol-cytochrome c reductase cytochrome c1 subunit